MFEWASRLKLWFSCLIYEVRGIRPLLGATALLHSPLYASLLAVNQLHKGSPTASFSAAS